MSWILTCVIIAFLLYLVYNGVALGLFGVPNSLSMTFYLFQEKKKWTRIFFPIMMISMAFLLLPAWLEISALGSLQFLAFLAAAGIMFVGAAPAFKSSDLENTVHMTSAIVAAIFAILWVVLVSKLWWVILVWLAVLGLIMLVTKTVKSSYIYWLETIAFMSTFTSILVYYLA
jgi:hypothetical protein